MPIVQLRGKYEGSRCYRYDSTYFEVLRGACGGIGGGRRQGSEACWLRPKRSQSEGKNILIRVPRHPWEVDFRGIKKMLSYL